MLSLLFYAFLVFFGEQVLMVRGFAPPLPPTTAMVTTTTTTTGTTSLQAMADPASFLDTISTAATSTAASSSWLLSTIDADIANISDNEFRPVFMGGIVVMFGGLLSALIVGLILEQKDSYASIVADSYVQGANDEEFWKGLSDEEQKKTRELLAKMKGNNNDNDGDSTPDVPAPVMAAVEESPAVQVTSEDSSTVEVVAATPPPEPVTATKKDMFSDY
mmetsp:Transcript_29840/g.62367  ORF Transcript_29840/g.62367 Transcript_29840/m.62367 type:complete len:219 (-) Transcript_29840:962-1618(-)